jgi:hypothetical protein
MGFMHQVFGPSVATTLNHAGAMQGEDHRMSRGSLEMTNLFEILGEDSRESTLRNGLFRKEEATRCLPLIVFATNVLEIAL